MEKTKKIIKCVSVMLVAIIMLVFLNGCDKTSTPTPSIDAKPTFDEIVRAVQNTNIKYYIDTLKVHFADLSDIELADLLEVSEMIEKVYGSGSVTLPNSRTVYTNMADIGRLTSYSSTTLGHNDAIMLIKNATLHKKEGTKTVDENINIVVLQGTDFNEGQATGIKEDLLVGLECSNYYLYDAFLAITQNIKEGSTLYITGLSLGGMVAQQLAGVDYLKEHYNIKYVNALGSPLILPENINYNKTRVSRLTLTNDIVPKLSNSATEKNWGEHLIVENGDLYYKSFVGAHMFGYSNDDIWGRYDVLGIKDGEAKISFENIESLTLHPAPNKEEYMKNM